jgi:hypothetical protein
MLLGGRQSKKAKARRPCTGLFVHGVPYANSAAKFWPALFDEVGDRRPDCSRMELTAQGAGPLHADQLYPETQLEQDLLRYETEDLAELMQNTLAVLGLTGPPTPVGIRLFAGNRCVLKRNLPDDCVDAEIFSFLSVWLLRWACIEESRWNDGEVDGRFAAEDRRRKLRYDISFTLGSRHLSEGLYHRVLSLSAVVTAEE